MKRLLLIVVCLIVPTQALAQQPTRSKYGLPPGPWTVSCGPRLKQRGPVVDLYKVGSSALTGITVTDVWLENRSKQDVAGVKLAWRVFDTTQQETTLLQGETPEFLAVPLNPGEKRKASYPLVTFAKIYRPLLVGRSELQGDYRIEVWVSDVRFPEDTGEQGRAAFAHVKKANSKAHADAAFVAVKSEPAPVEQDLGCQNQQCSWDNQNSCYRCVTSSLGTCKWFNCTYCEDGRCPGLGD
jgi:hypothetical protein